MKISVAKSDINGGVWKVLVQPGQTVAEGDTLLLIESMKMEIPVICENAGTVTTVHVAEGENVVPGQVVVTLKH